MTGAVRFMGAPGSPYTRKMLALLRYRRIPYEFLLRSQVAAMSLPKPKVALLPTFYLPNAAGEVEAVVDSTPLIRRFEREHRGRKVLPPDPVMAMVDALLEDYADEWLTKAMFHYRWQYAPDIDKAGSVLPFWHQPTMSAVEHARSKQQFSARQISRLPVVGSTAATASTIEASYRRFLDHFETLLQQQGFLMGDRPGASDFAVYGQLTQLTAFDPTPMALALDRAPRVCAWVAAVDDLSGHAPTAVGWLSVEAAGEVLTPLLAEVGRVHAPALLANAAAMARGEGSWQALIDEKPWEQATFPYHGRCLQALRDACASLDPDSRRQLDALLRGTGCEALFA